MTKLIFPRISLGLAGTVFAGMGLAFLVAPGGMVALVGLDLRKPGQLTEIMAMYGGLELGLGIFFLVAATRTRWIRAALAVQFLGLGGLALGRLLGVALTTKDRRMILLATVEIVGAIVGGVAFRGAKTALMKAQAEGRAYD